MKTSSSLHNEWIAKAENDLASAKILLKEEGPVDSICFHCQQAVEKYLKALLVYYGIRFEKIHNLWILAGLAKQKLPEILDFARGLKTLDAYYIEARYPPDIRIYSPSEGEAAFKIAREIVDFIRRQILL